VEQGAKGGACLIDLFIKKSPGRPRAFSFRVLTAFCSKALFAEYWLATLLFGAWFKRYLTVRATLSTDSVVHLAWTLTGSFLRRAAVLAALGSAQVLGGVKLLLAFREDECGTAVAAGDLLISHENKKEKK